MRREMIFCDFCDKQLDDVIRDEELGWGFELCQECFDRHEKEGLVALKASIREMVEQCLEGEIQGTPSLPGISPVGMLHIPLGCPLHGQTVFGSCKEIKDGPGGCPVKECQYQKGVS